MLRASCIREGCLQVNFIGTYFISTLAANVLAYAVSRGATISEEIVGIGMNPGHYKFLKSIVLYSTVFSGTRTPCLPPNALWIVSSVACERQRSAKAASI
jgi:hypothetical protein